MSKLVSVDFQGRDVLVEQLDTAKVIRTCDCGCKTVDIRVDKNCSRFPFPTRVPVEMTINQADGVPVVFYLHVMDGYVAELEVFRADSGSILEHLNTDYAKVTINKSNKQQKG